MKLWGVSRNVAWYTLPDTWYRLYQAMIWPAVSRSVSRYNLSCEKKWIYSFFPFFFAVFRVFSLYFRPNVIAPKVALKASFGVLVQY